MRICSRWPRTGPLQRRLYPIQRIDGAGVRGDAHTPVRVLRKARTSPNSHTHPRRAARFGGGATHASAVDGAETQHRRLGGSVVDVWRVECARVWPCRERGCTCLVTSPTTSECASPSGAPWRRRWTRWCCGRSWRISGTAWTATTSPPARWLRPQRARRCPACTNRYASPRTPLPALTQPSYSSCLLTLAAAWGQGEQRLETCLSRE